MIGSQDFKIGLDHALGGTTARLAISNTPPVNGQITPNWIFQIQTVSGVGAGNGVATHHWPLTGGGVSAGQVWWAQWIVDDPGAAGGQAFSVIANIRFFCGGGSASCGGCMADFNSDGAAGVDDLFQFLAAYFGGDIRADVNASGALSVQDIFDYLALYFTGCA
jgi:hypothetical protein